MKAMIVALIMASLAWSGGILMSYDDGDDSPASSEHWLTGGGLGYTGTYFEMEHFTESSSITIDSLELWVIGQAPYVVYHVAIFDNNSINHPDSIMWEDTLSKAASLLPITATPGIEIQGNFWVGVERVGSGGLGFWNCLPSYPYSSHSYNWGPPSNPDPWEDHELYYRVYATEGGSALQPTTWGCIKATLGE